MESDRFDALITRLAEPLSRRRSLELLSALGVAGVVSTGEDAAGKGKGNGKKKRKHRKKPTTTPAPTGPTCTDGFINGNETDVDCGGSCPRCGVGKVCQFRRDCTTAYCNEGTCTQCTNDTQCGADCGGCDNGTCVTLLGWVSDCAKCPAGTPSCPPYFEGGYYCLGYCGATLVT